MNMQLIYIGLYPLLFYLGYKAEGWIKWVVVFTVLLMFFANPITIASEEGWSGGRWLRDGPF